MGDPGPEGSIGKMESANLNKAIYEQVIALMGAEGMLYGSYAMRRPEGAGGAPTKQQGFLRSRANSIEGGTTEVMQNILGEHAPFLVRLDGLIERTRAVVEGPLAEILRDAAALSESLHDHEARETELFTNAVLTDLGSSG